MDSPSQSETNLLKSDILAYVWQAKKDGKADSTIERYGRALRQLAGLCNINDPEAVKAQLTRVEWKNTTRNSVVNAVSSYYEFKEIKWKAPYYQPEENLPFIPMEHELDALINTAYKTHSASLQLLKETGMRTDELMKLKWTDIDTERRLVTIRPSKGSNARILPISEKLVNMLNYVHRKNENLVTLTKHGFRIHFETTRKRASEKLGNPRLMQIHLHTFRHFKGTTEYLKVRDIYHVKMILGHKTVKNTEIYITIGKMLSNAQEEEYTCKVAHNAEEASKLIEAGFQYVQTVDGLHLYKKRK